MSYPEYTGYFFIFDTIHNVASSPQDLWTYIAYK